MKTKTPLSLCLFALALGGAMMLAARLQAAHPPTSPPTVHLVATDPCGAEEGSEPAGFTVIRIGPTNDSLTVQYSIGGTAVNGEDYQALTGAVTIPAGHWVAPIAVTPIDDFLVEGWESVVLALDQPPTWPPPYIVDWPSVAAAHIEDNDPQPTNRPPVVALVSPPEGAVFVGPVDIPLVARASDADGRVVSVEFFDGNVSLGVVSNANWPPIVRPGPVLARDDALALLLDPQLADAPDIAPGDTVPIPVHLFRLVWSNAPPGRHELSAVATDNEGARTRSDLVHIAILEQPPLPVVTVKATDPEGAEPDPLGPALDTATFTLQRTGPTDFPLTVWYRLTGTASNGVDYEQLPHAVTIPANESTADVVVRPLDDNLVEGDELVVLTIVPPICIDVFPPPPDCYLVGRPHEARAVLHDNDLPPNRPPAVTIVRPADGAVFLAPATIPIVAQALDVDGRVVTVEFFEGTNSLGVVTNTPSSVTNARPPYSLVWSNVPPGRYVLTAVATDDQGATGRSRPVEVRVVPIPEPPVINVVATDPVAAEPGILPVIETATFEVSRSGDLARPLTVFFSLGGTADNGVDYRLVRSPLVIPTGAATTNIVIDPLHDALVEGTETVVIELEEPPIASTAPWPYYVIGTNRQARAYIRDNDVPPTNQPPKVAIVRPENGDVFTAPAEIAICAAAADADGWVRTVEFFEGTNSLGIVSNRWNSTGGTGGNGSPGGASIDPPEQIFRLVWSNVPPGGYVLTAKATDNRGASTVSAPVHIRVIGHALPVVTIVATDPWASEGPLPLPWPGTSNHVGYLGPPVSESNLTDTARFTVTRSGGTNVDLTVYYTLTGTAENGVDYRELSGAVTIPRGAFRADIVVSPIDDRLREETETVVATLRPIACIAIYPPPPDCYAVGEPNAAVAYIRDNDVNLSPRVEIVRPPDNSVFVAPADITIDVVAVDPDGWVPRVQFFADGVLLGEREIVFIVPPPPGQPQTFSLTWTNVPVGPHVLTVKAFDNGGAVSVSDPVHVLVVRVAPIPVVTIEAVDPIATEHDPRLAMPEDPALFRVKRTGGNLSEPLRVFYRVSGTASNGVDYRTLPGEVTIPANDDSAPIWVVAIDDELVEGTESVVVTLEQLRCVTTNTPPPPGCYIVGQPGRGVAYIRDNDVPPNQPPKVALISPPNGATFTAPADIRLVAAAEDADGWVATVEFFANGTSLGIVTNHPWIVEPVRLPDLANAMLPEIGPAPIPIPPPFMLWWSNAPAGLYELVAVATDNDGASTRSTPVRIEIRPPDHVPIVQIFTTDGFAREGTTNTARFRVRRIGATNEPLTVHYSIHGTASNGVDYVAIPGSVTIPAGRRGVRIVITPIDDNLPEPPETVVLRLEESPLDVYPPPYIVGHPRVAAALIADNDHPVRPMENLTDGNVHFRLPLPDGLPYRLEASDNLVDWVPVICGTLATGDGIDFVEAERALRRMRFYRVVPEIEVEAEDE